MSLDAAKTELVDIDFERVTIGNSIFNLPKPLCEIKKNFRVYVDYLPEDHLYKKLGVEFDKVEMFDDYHLIKFALMDLLDSIIEHEQSKEGMDPERTNQLAEQVEKNYQKVFDGTNQDKFSIPTQLFSLALLAAGLALAILVNPFAVIMALPGLLLLANNIQLSISMYSFEQIAKRSHQLFNEVNPTETARNALAL